MSEVSIASISVISLYELRRHSPAFLLGCAPQMGGEEEQAQHAKDDHKFHKNDAPERAPQCHGAEAIPVKLVYAAYAHHRPLYHLPPLAQEKTRASPIILTFLRTVWRFF